MLKNPNSPLTGALVGARPLEADEDAAVDTTSVTVTGSVDACSIGGRGAAAGQRSVRDGTRSQEGMEGIPTDHELPPALEEGWADAGVSPRTSTLDADVDGG